MLCQVVNILNALRVAENSDTEWLHNAISNIFEVVLKDGPLLPPHRLSQLEATLLLEVDALVQSQVGIPVIISSVTLRPIPEVIYR